MTKKEIIFQDDSVSIIELLVKKYGLAMEGGQKDDVITPDILAAGEIAQAARDVVEKRRSIDDYSSIFQKTFGVSSEKADSLAKELGDLVISRAEEIEFNERGGRLSKESISVSNIKTKKILTDVSIQDSYREPPK